MLLSSYGHETNSCWNLQDVIESAVQLDFDQLARTASFLREEVKGLSDSRKSFYRVKRNDLDKIIATIVSLSNGSRNWIPIVAAAL